MLVAGKEAESSVQEYPPISFDITDFKGFQPHSDDPIVIRITTSGYKVATVLVDGGSSANVMYWSCFQDLKLQEELLKNYPGTLVGFTGEQVEVRGFLDLRTTFGKAESEKTMVLRYMVVNAPSSYNVIVGRPTLNALMAAISYPHLCLKYPLPNGGVGIVQGDQAMARRCYAESARAKAIQKEKATKSSNCSFLDLDPRMYDAAKEEKRPRPADDLKEVIIGPAQHLKRKIGTGLSPEMEDQLVNLLSDNVHIFAWSPQDMPGIDPNFVRHRLSLNPSVQPVTQRKRKQGLEKTKAIKEEADKLLAAEFIREVKYPL